MFSYAYNIPYFFSCRSSIFAAERGSWPIANNNANFGWWALLRRLLSLKDSQEVLYFCLFKWTLLHVIFRPFSGNWGPYIYIASLFGFAYRLDPHTNLRTATPSLRVTWYLLALPSSVWIFFSGDEHILSFSFSSSNGFRGIRKSMGSTLRAGFKSAWPWDRRLRLLYTPVPVVRSPTVYE